MRWGDFVDGTSETRSHILELLRDQAERSIPLLEGLDMSKPFRIGWFVEQDNEIA